LSNEVSMKTGFCFSGEGARGSVQAGIALSLYHRGIKPDLVIGTSSGTACSIGYAYKGAQGLADLWSSVKNILSLFSLNWQFLWDTGFFKQKPMEKILFDMVKNEPVCESIVLRMHIETGEVQYVSNLDVSSEEFAEAALCGVAVTAMVADRNGWVDAGSREMAPLQTCIEKGCDEIYIILGRPFAFPQWKKPRRGPFKFALMGYRALDISLFEMLLRDINKCLSNPDVKLHIMEPIAQPFDSILFRRCKFGVQYGMTQYREIQHEDVQNLVQRNMMEMRMRDQVN
jgi:predicted patatin/cPLA2 family phospholipase